MYLDRKMSLVINKS